jgi:hypothetical protein
VEKEVGDQKQDQPKERDLQSERLDQQPEDIHANLNNSSQQVQQQQQQQPEHQQSPLSENDTTSKCLSTTCPAYVIPPFYFPVGKPVASSKRRERTLGALVSAKSR